MKGKQAVEIAIVAGLMILWGAADAHAFHAGGSAGCEGCHTMHNSQGGKGINGTSQFQAGMYLLQGADQSCVCLTSDQGGGPSNPRNTTSARLPKTCRKGVAPSSFPREGT